MSATAARIAWEIAQLLGALALLACLVLCTWVLRPRKAGAHTLALRRHELIGWLALGCAAAHALMLLGTDTRVIEDFRLRGPRYEWAGLAALLLLLLLTVPATPTLRRRLWQRHRGFQAQHVLLAAAIVVLGALHVLVSGRYVHGRLAAGGLAFLCIGCLLSLLRPRGSARASLPLAQRLVFGRHSRLIALALPLAAGLLALWFVPGAALMLRAPLGGGGGPKLTSIFPHDKHREVPCVQCHHNFTDHTGEGSCYDCHRSSRVDLKAGLEARFHDFCLGCHRDPPPAARDHGPATGCATCHL